MVCDKEEAAEEEEAEEEEPGYRIKNSNPTQRCGESQSAKKNIHYPPTPPHCSGSLAGIIGLANYGGVKLSNWVRQRQ